jgi:hypothetical protein
MLHSKDDFLLPISEGDTKIFIQDVNGDITFSFNPWRVTSTYYKDVDNYIKLQGTDNPLKVKFRTPKESLEALTILQGALDNLKEDTSDIPQEIIDYIDTKILEIINNNHFSFRQQTPSDTWLVNHDIGRKASIMVTNDNLETMVGLIKYIDDDNVEILFNQSVTGWVFVN